MKKITPVPGVRSIAYHSKHLDNEDRNKFRSNSVIDTYEFATGKYLESFYIPKLDDKHITDFKIINDTLFALYETELKIFKFNKK